MDRDKLSGIPQAVRRLLIDELTVDIEAGRSNLEANLSHDETQRLRGKLSMLREMRDALDFEGAQMAIQKEPFTREPQQHGDSTMNDY